MQQSCEVSHLEFFIAEDRVFEGLFNHSECKGVADIGAQDCELIPGMAIAEGPEKADKSDDDQPHDPLADSLLVIGEIKGHEVDEDGSYNGEGVGKKVNNEADDELF